MAGLSVLPVLRDPQGLSCLLGRRRGLDQVSNALIFLFASGKVEGETAKRLKECCGGCEGERHLLPRLLSEVSQRGSSKWECLEAGPSGPRDWYVPCQTWNSEGTPSVKGDERVISQNYQSR